VAWEFPAATGLRYGKELKHGEFSLSIRACAVRDSSSFASALSMRQEKDQGATGGNPHNGPLAARNRNRFHL